MAKPDWTLKFIKMLFPRTPDHGKITRLPCVARWLERRFFEGDHLIALPRDEVIRVDEAMEDEGQMVLPSQLVEAFIEKARYHWIMDFCLCRRSMSCSRYPVEMGCLFMGEAVLDINPAWGRLVSPQEARDHIRRCQEKGLIHFMGRSKLDTVWLGIGPGHRLLTICNCCPCCCITRGIAHTDPLLSDKLHRAPGVTVQVAEEDCTGCGNCLNSVCFADAIRMREGTAFIGEACRGCGRCVEACPSGAIRIRVDSRRFLEENVEQISRLVDLT